jgi:hypothetical protein
LICAENFEASDICADAKETCYNWFSKIGAVQDLLPRMWTPYPSLYFICSKLFMMRLSFFCLCWFETLWCHVRLYFLHIFTIRIPINLVLVDWSLLCSYKNHSHLNFCNLKAKPKPNKWPLFFASEAQLCYIWKNLWGSANCLCFWNNLVLDMVAKPLWRTSLAFNFCSIVYMCYKSHIGWDIP